MCIRQLLSQKAEGFGSANRAVHVLVVALVALRRFECC